MHLAPITTFLRLHWLESGGLLTLAASLWLAFGPLRHRLPRVLTRFGKYSATLKLLSLSALCFFTLHRFLTDEAPSAALNWLLACLGLMLLGSAGYVLTRKQARRDRPRATPDHEKRPPATPTAL